MPGKERELWGSFHEDARLISEGQSSLHGLLKPVNLEPEISSWTAMPLGEDWPSLLNRSFQSQAVPWQFTEKGSEVLEGGRALL